MHTEKDDLDKLIINSFEEKELSDSYNANLLNKLSTDKSKRNQEFIGAFSLIMAGFMAIFIYTSGVQYRFIELEVKVKSRILSIQYKEVKNPIIKYFIGE